MLVKLASFLISCVSLTGNSLICHIILHAKVVKKSSFNYVILNLAIVDAITSILAIYNTSVNGLFGVNLVEKAFNKSEVVGDILCRMKVAFWFGSLATPALLLVIAYERFKAVVQPLLRRNGSFSNRLKLILVACWLWGVVPIAIFILAVKTNNKTCAPSIAPWFNNTVYSTISVNLHFILPCLIMSFLYYKVVTTIKKDDGFGFQEAVQRERQKSKKKVVKIIITVTVLFYLFCGIPHLAHFIAQVSNFQFWSKEFQSLLYTFNIAANPLIYFIFMNQFRKGLIGIFKQESPKVSFSFSGSENSKKENSIFVSKVSMEKGGLKLLSFKSLTK